MRKKPVNKLLSLLLALTLVLGMLPMTVQAASAPVMIGTTGYSTLTAALAAAANGDVIILNGSITESASYTGSADNTVTIDGGGGHTLTGDVDGSGNSTALSLSGTGTVKLKNLTLQGGASTISNATSTGLDVSGSVSVQSYGTVTANGGASMISCGLVNNGTGTVDVTAASATGDMSGHGVENNGSGTVNVITATGNTNHLMAVGVLNSSGGTVNVYETTGNNWGIFNNGSGTVNVSNDVSISGVYNSGTVNAGTVSGDVTNTSTGAVNAGIITGITYLTEGTVNTGADATVTIPLRAGTGASCVLDAITIANSGTTQIGTLPNVYKGDACSAQWYIGVALTNLFTMQEISPEATLYSSFYTVETAEDLAAYITEVSGLAASTSGDTVTVTGTATLTSTSDAALTLYIPSGVTVVWKASLSGGGSMYLLEPKGDGTFEVADGANIENTTCQTAIYCYDGSGTLLVTGGIVSTPGLGMTIGIEGDWLLTMTGGTVSADADQSCAIYGRNSVVITGGTVSASGTDGYQLFMGNTSVYRSSVLDSSKIKYYDIGDDFADVSIDAAVTQAQPDTSTGLTVTGHNLPSEASVTAVWAIQNGISGVNIHYSDRHSTTADDTEFLAVPGVTVADSPADSISPTVTSVTPSGTGVDINGNIAITFSEPMNTVSGVVYLSSDGGGSYGSELTGGSWSVSDSVYTIPYSGLSYDTTYTIRLEAFKDTAGNVMSVDTSHSFTTKTDPSATTYAVNIEVVTGGSITVNKTTATEADIINLTIIPDSGKRLKAGTLKYNDGTDHAITGTSFTMPAADVTVSAEFEEIPSTVTNEEKVAADKAILDIHYATGDDASSVTQDLSLTVIGAVYGSNITWVSDNTDIISNTGTVTRPAYASGDANVTVTASIYNNGVSDSKSFSLKVLKCAVPAFTVTFDPAGGTRTGGGELTQTIAQGSAAMAPTVTRSRYTFSGWDKNFSNITGNMTVTALWTYNSGGNSGSGGSSGGGSSSSDQAPTMQPEKKPDQPVSAGVTVTAKADKAGISTVTVPEQSITSTIAKAQADAKASGNTDNGIGVALNVTMPKGSDSLTLTLTSNSLQSLVAANVQNLEINGAPVSLGLDLIAIQEIQKQSTGSVTVSFTPVTGLKEDAKTLIGTRPIYNISISYVKDGKTVNITSLGNGSATLSIPYTPGKKETKGYLFGVYVDVLGKATRIKGSTYDANSKSIIFNSNHFSVYGVGYTVPSEKFKDISSHWAKESIDYVVGRGLFSGTSTTAFSPDAAMSRGMLVTALGRLAGVDVSDYKTVSFTDVAADKYYAPYIEWAYKNGIVSDIGNSQFAPDRAITREEIARILSNYAKATGYTLPVTREAAAFADDDRIGSTYKEAVKAMQQAGIMMGGNGNKFNPGVSATRAEVSAMLHRYIKLTIDPATAQGWAVNDAGQRLYYKDGKALTGWQTIESKKYFFDTDGAMQTGWKKDDKSNWYYLSINGALVGWQNIGSGDSKKRYYFTKDAIMVSAKWLEIDKKWYYFNTDGSLAVSTKVDGYEVDKNGVRQSK